MILYHPATDFYHCWMRLASLLRDDFERGVEYDRARIMDFYLCFPHEIAKCSLPSEFSAEVRKQARALPRGYEDRLSVRQAFQQMSSIQRQVVMDMMAKGVLRRDSYREGVLLPSADETRRELLISVASELEPQHKSWLSVLLKSLGSIQLNGKNGLKDRSGLLEFRYDG